MVITFISYVGLYGKGFSVDSSPCFIPLFFSCLCSLVQAEHLIFMWLVCGWFQTRGTWGDGFFSGTVWFVTQLFLYHS